MDRLINYPSRGKDVDQLKAIRELLPQGVSRRRQAITWIPERDLFVKEDQPCLQRLWVRDIGNGNAKCTACGGHGIFLQPGTAIW